MDAAMNEATDAANAREIVAVAGRRSKIALLAAILNLPPLPAV